MTPATNHKWLTMLRLQGPPADQLEWLACHVGRLYERLERAERRLAAMRGAATRQRKRTR